MIAMLGKSLRALRRFAVIALAAYVLLLALLWGFQEKLLFHPPAEPLARDFKFPFVLPHEELTVAHEGEKAHGVLAKSKDSRGLILYFHGNAGDLRDWFDLAEHLASRLSFDVLMVDYPGFGKSEGAIRSEEQLHGMAAEFFKVAKEKAGARPLVLFGRSIGSGLAVPLAAKNYVSALVLETPYLSMESLAGGMFPWVPTFVLRYRLRSDLWMRNVNAPVLILHGDRDELIPHASGLELSKLVKNGRFVTIEGGHHNDLGGSEFYWAELGAFFSRLASP